MKPALTLAALLLLLVVPTTVSAQITEMDWVHGTDFSQFHTCTWATAAYPIQDADASLGMAIAVQHELEAKGVQFVDSQGKFDLFVTYNAIINPDPQDSSRQILTLKLRIFDAKNNNVIWRAGGYVALVADKAQNRRNARALLAEMFQLYPPPPEE